VKRLASLTLGFICASIVWSPCAIADVKIGFVNIVQIMEQAPQAETARKALEQEFSGRDAKLTAERDAIVELEKKLQTDGEIMNAAQRDELESEIARRKLEFSRDAEALKEDFNIRRNEELTNLQRVVYDVIVGLAKSENYDLIVTERVLYASERVNVTDEVLERLRVNADE
jgi:outer membrane protein